VCAAGEVVAELMGKQDGQQGQGERPAEQETAGLGKEPWPGPEIALVDHGGQAIEEILHEAGADGGGSDHTDRQQSGRQAVFAPS